MTDLTSQPPGPADVEELAALVHHAWVEHRLRAGWRYGDQRSDTERISPALVPYDRLPETQRDLDRVTVRATLGGLTKLGYRIDRAKPAGGEELRDELLSQVDRLIARGLPLPAYDLTKRWLATHADDDRFRLLNARALRRSGALQRAEAVLEELAGRPDEDGERRGLLAAVNKEMFARALRRDARAAEHLRRAEQLYREVFDESRDAKYWHGINAATLAFVLGREDDARAIAARVLATCDTVERSGGDDYWWLATRAEAALVQGRFEVAAALYRDALRVSGERIGDVASTRFNALLLLDAYGADVSDRSAIEAALRPPAVIVFAGVPIDTGDSLHPRFPAAAEERIRTALAERLDQLHAIFGFSGAAAGAELLFVEAMLERRPSVVNVVLPWPPEQFAQTHVRGAGGTWPRRFEHALGGDGAAARVNHVVSASLGVGIDSPLYERFARQLLTGLANIHASTLGTEAIALVVADGPPSKDARSEIPELVQCWESVGIRLPPENVIDLSTFVLRRSARQTSGVASSAQPSVSQPFDVKAILFADVEDYSKIPEDRLPAFIEYFVGGIGARMGLKPYKPDNLRRVGDGLLMVFSRVRDAGLCALELVEWSSSHSQLGADGETYWSRLGLPKTMRIRIALHAGPVFACVDPLTHAPTFEGAHINYAARIEPVTPGNQVYASEAFAALAASWPAPCEEFVCEYVGRTSLAKKAGEYPLYHVRRRV
jgi:hypothetical protein